MVNKSLYSSLDAHLNKVKSGLNIIKAKKVNSKKISIKKRLILFLKKVKIFFLKLKNSIFPEITFKHSKIHESKTTVVEIEEKGLKCNCLKFLRKVKIKLMNKRLVEEEKRKNPEDIDVNLIKYDLHKNKIK